MKYLLRYTTTLLALLVIGLCGCTTDLIDAQSDLSVSVHEIVFDNQTMETTVEVKTSQTEWSYVAGVDWIECTRLGNKLQVKAKPNMTGADRVTTLIITSGLFTDKIVVKQGAGNGAALFTDKTDYKIEQWGDHLVIPIYSRNKDWEAVSTEDWLTVQANKVKGELRVQVAETELRLERKASILVRNLETGEHLTINVTQDGIMYFIFPYLQFGEGEDKFIKFEEARKSILLSKPGDDYSSSDLYKFKTHSKIFHRTEYRVKDNKLVVAYAYSEISKLDNVFSEFLDYLHSLGYEDVPGSGLQFYNKGTETLCEIGLSSNRTEAYFSYSYLPVQRNPLPTFNTFPTRLADQDNWAFYTTDQLYAWETSQGFVTTKKEGHANALKTKVTITYRPQNPDNSDFASIVYTMKKDEKTKQMRISTMQMTLKEGEATMNKVFWSKNSQYYLTKEFLALADKATFKYVSKNALGKHLFISNSKNLLLSVHVEVKDGQQPKVVLEFTL